MNKRALIIYLLVFTGLSVFGQSKEKAIDDYFKALVKNQQFSGNVLVVDKNEVVYERSFGYADQTVKTPNTLNITFPIASITKIFTATAILQLKEKGLLNITDPVRRLLYLIMRISMPMKMLLR